METKAFSGQFYIDPKAEIEVSSSTLAILALPTDERSSGVGVRMSGILSAGVLRTCIAGLETLGCLERSAERAYQLPLTIHFFYLSLRYHVGSSICYARSRIFLRASVLLPIDSTQCTGCCPVPTLSPPLPQE